ncbi:MAG: hypothetical protein H0U35_02925 [Sporichthyaceae bacterium]|nr:hypothetical protein [Sporichthyaceae bacterium]
MHDFPTQFVQAEDAYRRERISASFRDHTAAGHRVFRRRHLARRSTALARVLRSA